MASPTQEYPAGPCPPEDQIKNHIRTIFKEVGPHSLTMKILRLRLSSIYKIDFKEHTGALQKWVQEVISEPETEALMNQANKEANKKVGGTRKSKSTTKKARGDDDKKDKKTKKHRAEGEPKRGQTAFFLYAATVRPQVQEEVKAANNGKMDVAQIGSKLGEMWKNLDAETKAKFEEDAQKDKERYKTEMDAWLAEGNVKGGNASSKSAKKEKDPNKPKKPQTAYFAYMGEVAPALREQSKTENNGKVDIAAVGKKVGEQWNNLTADEKKQYEAIAAKDRQRYERECEEKGYPYKKADGAATTAEDAAASDDE